MAPLNLHHLRLFRAVALDGTLTGAAARLNLSPSALSSQLRGLEAAVGHDLFERRGRGLVLTEAGRIALDHAEAIFRTAEDLSATLAQARSGRRVLRVGALATLSRNFQMRFLAPALGRADAAIALRSGGQADLLAALGALALDVVLTDQAPPAGGPARFRVLRLAAQQVALIGTPARIGAETDPAALIGGAPLILPPADSALRAGFEALAAGLGVRPQVVAEVDDMAMMRLLARGDAGLALIPPIVVQDELAAGVLRVGAVLPQIEETFMAVTVERRFPHPLVAELCRAAAR
jgi:LysR family transcriptional regulator, transcriptional activator of nhaA